MRHRWWGYVHTNGSLQLKRFFNKGDLAEAAESPFVSSIWGPFFADNRDEAIKILTSMLERR